MAFIADCRISYIIAAKLYRSIQAKIAGHTLWLGTDTGIDIGETEYGEKEGHKGRRMIIVRQHIQDRPKASGKQLRLFQENELYNHYRYHCFITNLPLPAQQVWNLYKHRADAENLIKELKYDFGFDSFNLASFYGTEAALNMVMMAYKFMSLFRQAIMGSTKQPKLSTLRYRLFAIGASMVKEGNHRILKLSLAMKRRAWFLGLWGKTSQFSLPVPLPP